MITVARKKPRGKRRAAHPSANGKPVEPDQIIWMDIDEIIPAPQNDKLYKPVSPKDPDIRALAKSMKKIGVQEPLRITIDNVLISGHRRLCAARLAGLRTVPVIVVHIRSTDPGFLILLREANRQRVKTLAEVTREQVIDADPVEAHRVLVEHRKQQSKLEGSNFIEIVGVKHRPEITDAKRPFLEAILQILRDRREFWPLSVRQVHYVLLNNPPLIHASKPKSHYRNNRESYKAAIDIIARGRLAKVIPWDAIDDETRPIETWRVFSSVAPFVSRELDGFLKDYYRDLLQSQPNQIELLGEKNTIASIIRPIAAEYCIPFTIGRGYSSLPPRMKMAQRFRESGKEKLIVLVVSDHDPEGDDIPRSFGRSMRDDFGIPNDKLVPIKVALTEAHVAQFSLQPNNLESKKGGARYGGFVKRFGNQGYELEATAPADLQQTLRDAIDSVIDVSAFNAEVEAEKRDAAHLDVVRRAMKNQLADVKFE